MIYGNNQPPVTISVDDADLRQRILAGRFLTTIYDIDLEGKKHRVIPRDFHLDAGARSSRSMSTSCGSAKAPPSASAFPCTCRTRKPRRASSAAAPSTSSPTPSISNARSTTFRNSSRPMSADSTSATRCICPTSSCRSGVKSLSREDVTLVTIVPPSGYAEEQKAAAAAAAAAGPVVAATPGAAPAAGCRCRRAGSGRCGRPGGGRQGACRWRRQEEVSERGMPRHATVCWSR